MFNRIISEEELIAGLMRSDAQRHASETGPA